MTSVVSHPRPGDECDVVLVSGLQSREGDAESVHAAAVWGEGPGVQVRSRARSGCPAGRGRRGAGPAPAAPLGDPGSPAGQGHWALARHAPLALGATGLVPALSPVRRPGLASLRVWARGCGGPALLARGAPAWPTPSRAQAASPEPAPWGPGGRSPSCSDERRRVPHLAGAATARSLRGGRPGPSAGPRSRTGPALPRPSQRGPRAARCPSPVRASP